MVQNFSLSVKVAERVQCSPWKWIAKEKRDISKYSKFSMITKVFAWFSVSITAEVTKLAQSFF